jgi:hypothetical protein
VEHEGLSLLLNSFWIIGFALLLANLSYHYDRAQRRMHAFRTQLGSRSFAIWAWISLALISLGLAGTSTRWWETIIWICFSLLGVASALGARREQRPSTSEKASPPE